MWHPSHEGSSSGLMIASVSQSKLPILKTRVPQTMGPGM